MKLLPIRQALISVFDKNKILKISKKLFQHNIQILSTNGTTKILKRANLPTIKISDLTNFPEIMQGRIKTLHHKIYGGILNRQNLDDSIIDKYGIKSIDMIIVNFYPIKSIIQKENHNTSKILENIDIGGPCLVRAAAKNYKNKVVVTNIYDYEKILQEIDKYNGCVSLNTRFILAAKAFKYVSEYDHIISNYFNQKLEKIFINQTKEHNQFNKNNNLFFPKKLKIMNLEFIKKQDLRYGENPHQKSALYIEKNLKKSKSFSISTNQLQGKPLSYNNFLDIDTALKCINMFTDPTCIIIKHANPCSAATSTSIINAYNKAYETDSISAFGSFIAFNRPLNQTISKKIIHQKFVEGIIAPNIDSKCLKIFSEKKNLIVLNSKNWKSLKENIIHLKQINEGFLIQEYNNKIIDLEKIEIVTKKHPTKKEMQDALFAWKIVKFVKSNAIVYVQNNQTISIGAGQTSRIDAVKIANLKLEKNKHFFIKKLVMASDAFFPFSDSITTAAKMNISCIIQPGGSIRDQEVIKEADKHKISMIFTHIRHFRH